MRKILLLPAAAAMAVLTALATSPASAQSVDVLTAGGNNVTAGNPGDTIVGTSTSAVLSTSAGSITCNSASFTADVQTNPEAPGSATEQVTVLSASSCKSSIAGTTSVKSVGLTSGDEPTATVDDSGPTLTITPSVTVVLGTVLGQVTCIYSGTLVASVDNTDNAIDFDGATVTKQTGSSSVCPSSGTYTSTYSPVEDTSVAGDPAVVVN
jgi:hypothetical protein